MRPHNAARAAFAIATLLGAAIPAGAERPARLDAERLAHARPRDPARRARSTRAGQPT
jgi:hypothetical protein